MLICIYKDIPIFASFFTLLFCSRRKMPMEGKEPAESASILKLVVAKSVDGGGSCNKSDLCREPSLGQPFHLGPRQRHRLPCEQVAEVVRWAQLTSTSLEDELEITECDRGRFIMSPQLCVSSIYDSFMFDRIRHKVLFFKNLFS